MENDNRKPALIVVIEDNPADVSLLRVALDEQQEPYVLHVLQDGEEALQFVQEQSANAFDPQPCVIVLDLHLPKYDGLAVLNAIKREPLLAHVKVVIVATLANPKEELETQRLGVQLYRQKPTDLNDFLELGKEILAICKDTTVELPV